MRKCQCHDKTYDISKFWKFEKNEEFSFWEIVFSIFFSMKRHSTSPPCGNQVDGVSHDVQHTETVAKPARPSAAQNDELTHNLIELARLCYMKYEELKKVL